MSVLDTLITDRTQADVTRWKTLHDKGWSRMSPEEKVEWSSGLKGTYNATDLNRVTAAMEELDQQFRQYGYSTGYQRIEIPHGGNQGVTYLEYIESSGTQYIDTGHKPTNNSRVVMEVEALKGGVYPFFGARTANGVGSFVLWEMSASSIRSDFNTTGTETTVSKVLSHVVIDKNKNVCKFGDTTITNGAASFNCSYNLCLLALNSGGEVDERKLSAKLYRCQVYDNDTLIHDFRPALDGDGIACLWDEVSKTFYHNAGTGEFKAGPLFTIQQLEYIESSGTQYIDTGFIPNQDTRVWMDFELLSITGQYADPIFGVRTSATSKAYYFWCPGTTDSTERYQSGYNNSSTYPSVMRVGRHTVDKNKNVTTVDGVTTEATYATFAADWSLLLFNSYNNGSLYGQTTKMKLYACKVYDNETLIRDYVPCRSSSGAVGLYDLINQVFYVNAGTGVFTAGPQIGSDPVEEEGKDPYTWYEDDIPTADLMEGYLANVSALRSTIELLATTPEAPESIELLTYIEANNIEQILIDIRLTIDQVVRAFKRSNAYTFWSGYAPLPSADSNLGRTWNELDAMEAPWKNLEEANWYLLNYGNLGVTQ